MARPLASSSATWATRWRWIRRGPTHSRSSTTAPLAAHDLTVEGLRADGVVVLPESGPGGSIDQLGLTAPLDCVPDGLRSTLERGHDLFRDLQAEPDGQLKLITRRTSHMINSALQNIEKLKARGAASNPLWMHPDDAQRLGLAAGDIAEVRNDHGAIRAEVSFDPNLRPGVVAMTHGFGNAGTSGMPNAQRYPGVNVNLLGPSGAGSFEPVSGMGHLTGICVDVAAVSAAVPVG